MKTEFKNHIKYGSCWYDQFFKINQRSTIVNKSVRKNPPEKSGDKQKNHEHKK
jgi:hypothetical protein